MLGLYGHRWASQYGTTYAGTAADTWGAVLADLAPAQLAEGLRACVAEGGEWPPAAPRFRAMCFGIPSIAAVRLELQRGTPSRFARLVWQNVDPYAHRQAQRREADRMVEDAYDIAREHVMRGGALPSEPAAMIEHDKPAKPQLPETPEERAERLRLLLGEDYNPDTADPNYDPHEAHKRAQREAAEAELMAAKVGDVLSDSAAALQIDHMRQLYNPPSLDEE